MSLQIEQLSDWQDKLVKQGMTTVVDPMVLRCGELFLKGARGVQDKEAVWELLNKNLIALGMFFDLLILHDKIPVFNYGDTFDSGLNLDQRTFAKVNESCEIFHEVDVTYLPYHEVKNAAFEELKKVIRGPNRISQDMAKDILSELSAAEYNWKMSLWGLDGELESETDKKLATYLLGALIFGGYAQIMESEHILQPKRSRTLLALGLDRTKKEQKKAEELFAELKARANTTVEDLPWQPTFFPYLLSKAENPAGLVDEVMKLRGSGEVKEYKTWYQEIMEDIKMNGHIHPKKKVDIRGIAESVDRRIQKISIAPKVDIKISIGKVTSAIVAQNPFEAIPGEMDLNPPVQALWGWILERLPGKGYRKLLSRAVAADHDYVLIENRVKTVWEGG